MIRFKSAQDVTDRKGSHYQEERTFEMTHSVTKPIDKRAQALIYCRASSAQQNASNTELDAQEKRCRAYADAKGYKVAKVFSETEAGGDMADRPEILALLTHISSDPDARFIVIVDDHGRIGRDPRTAVAFREELKDHNARFECASVARAATPEQEFVENVLAARAELDDHLNDKEDA